MLNKRQDAIIKLIDKQGNLSVAEIFDNLKTEGYKTAKITIKRDLKKLVDHYFLVSQGAGRSVTYKLSPHHQLIQPLDVDQYFSKEIDDRNIQEKFNMHIFSQWGDIFSEEEKSFLQKLNDTYRKRIAKLEDEVIKKEFERLTIELSWKSSKIEGNTYSLLETEQLLKEHKEAPYHTKKEAIMILNHKTTLDYIRKHVSEFKRCSVKDIEEIHTLLTNGLGIAKNIRKTLVRITGTRFQPLDNEFQIKESLKKTCSLIDKQDNPFEKAVTLMLFIAYIQPFIDGNKRTSRLAGNAVLLAHDCCPLSYRTIDEGEYKKAVLLFYEQNNVSYFKKLFLGQFEFVVENYF